jgi:hypothetical protein
MFTVYMLVDILFTWVSFIRDAQCSNNVHDILAIQHLFVFTYYITFDLRRSAKQEVAWT